MGGNTRVGQSQKTFRGHSRDFQGIKFPRLQVPQDSLDCSAYRFLSVKTEYGCADFTSQPEEAPSRFADFSTQSVPIEILDQSPASRPGLAFELQRFRQKGAFLDQSGSRFDSVCHLRLRCIFNGAYDCHAHSFTVTRHAGLDLLLTSY